MIFRRKKRTSTRRPPRRAHHFESLEARNLLTATPFGASEVDTGEYLLGSVYVSVVAFESDGSRDANLEDWNDPYRNQVKTNVQEGLQWWRDTLDTSFPGHQHELNFIVDFTHLDTPIQTGYEPISRPSFDFQLWTNDFFDHVEFDNGDFSSNSRAFNHAQREANETDWAFTIFVVNDENDPDGRFEPGGFDRAFAFSGGRFFVTPAGRPNSTFAHETGHMFWARDEYRGGGNYTQHRGYYDAQNLNAWDNPDFLSGAEQRAPSIMDRGACDEDPGLLCTAFEDHTSSDSSFAMIGWVDSDGDGIFDVLDVPLTLEGSGNYDSDQGLYHFLGASSVQTLPNMNSSGPQNDISVNHVSLAQYRVNGSGPWLPAERYDDFTASLDLAIPLLAGDDIEIRTVDDITGQQSAVFQGTSLRPTATLMPGLNGFVWHDDNQDGIWDEGETPLANRTVRLIDENGDPLELHKAVEPDAYPSQSTLLNNVIPEVTLSSIGFGTSDDSVFSLASPTAASTGSRVFANFCSGFCTEWTQVSRQLRMDFTVPVTTVSIDAIAKNVNDHGRLEIYDANDQLLARYTTKSLAAGQFETMSLSRPIAEIAYAIAGAHTDRTILLDNLQFGPQVSAMTDVHGVYRLPYLEPDTYTVELVAVAGTQPTSPVSGQQSRTLAAGEAIGEVDFGVIVSGNRWQNPRNRFDVNNDDFVSPTDVLLIINDLNANGPHALVDEPSPPFLDVNGDGLVTANDVLQVINAINSGSGSEGESGSSLAPFSPGTGSPEGEASLAASFIQGADATPHVWLAGVSTPTTPTIEVEANRGRKLGWRFESSAAATHADHQPATRDPSRETLAAHDQFMRELDDRDLADASTAWDSALVDVLADGIMGRS